MKKKQKNAGGFNMKYLLILTALIFAACGNDVTTKERIEIADVDITVNDVSCEQDSVKSDEDIDAAVLVLDKEQIEDVDQMPDLEQTEIDKEVPDIDIENDSIVDEDIQIDFEIIPDAEIIPDEDKLLFVDVLKDAYGNNCTAESEPVRLTFENVTGSKEFFTADKYNEHMQAVFLYTNLWEKDQTSLKFYLEKAGSSTGKVTVDSELTVKGMELMGNFSYKSPYTECSIQNMSYIHFDLTKNKVEVKVMEITDSYVKIKFTFPDNKLNVESERYDEEEYSNSMITMQFLTKELEVIYNF
jgi:hypothetical protein